MGQSGLFFIYFRSFQTNNTIFTTNEYEKMSIEYMAPGFEPMTFRTWVVTHNHWTRAKSLARAKFKRKDNLWAEQAVEIFWADIHSALLYT